MAAIFLPMSTTLAAQILDAITADFMGDGAVFERTHDNLRYELEAQNDWATENIPGAEEVTLLQLLQASTAKLKAGEQDPAKIHIHELIEYAFIEQEAHRAIAMLFPTLHHADLLPAHLPILEAAVRDHLSEQGLTALNALFERVKQRSTDMPDPLPDYRACHFLQFGHDVHIDGDPTTAESFARALRFLETITDHFIEFDLWEKTPADLAYELTYHNNVHRSEVEQTRKNGEPAAEIDEITLANLRALSKRRLLAMDETGWNLTHFYRPVGFMDKLIEKATTAEAEIQALIIPPNLEKEVRASRAVTL